MAQARCRTSHSFPTHCRSPFDSALTPGWQLLKPGARVVSHWHDMGDWLPDGQLYLRVEGRGRNVYRWTLPPR